MICMHACNSQFFPIWLDGNEYVITLCYYLRLSHLLQDLSLEINTIADHHFLQTAKYIVGVTTVCIMWQLIQSAPANTTPEPIGWTCNPQEMYGKKSYHLTVLTVIEDITTQPPNYGKRSQIMAKGHKLSNHILPVWPPIPISRHVSNASFNPWTMHYTIFISNTIKCTAN